MRCKRQILCRCVYGWHERWCLGHRMPYLQEDPHPMEDNAEMKIQYDLVSMQISCSFTRISSLLLHFASVDSLPLILVKLKGIGHFLR